MQKPKVSEKEIDKLEKQFDEFDNQVKNLTIDRMNSEAKVVEQEPQTKLSSKEMEKIKETWLKASRWIADGQKFNEKFQKNWEFDKEYVTFIAENKEVIGEKIEIWTHPYGGKGAEFWQVPVNTPVKGPRYLAEQIRKCVYCRLKMDETRNTGSDGKGTYYGTIVIDQKVPRLTAEPVSENRKSVFMNAERNFAA